MDPMTTLERAVDTCSGVLGNIAPDQLDKPTPCPNYDVKALTEHLVGAMGMFAKSVAGHDAAVEPGGDPKAAFDQAAAALVEVWKQPGMLEKTFTLPFGDFPGSALAGMASMEVMTHGWDLAKATGQSTAFPEDLSTAVLGAARQTLQPEYRGTGPDASFGPEVEVAADAHPADLLAAFMGRQP